MNDTQDPIIQDLINDSAALVEVTVDLEKQASLVPSLQDQVKTANLKIAQLIKADTEQKEAIRVQTEKCATVLEKVGFKINKQAFIDRVVANPIELCGVIEKIASEVSVPQLGSGDESTKTAAALDPIEAWLAGE